jgi:hypothetical protein
MASIINAGTTTATALNMITDTTGALVIQTSGANAISISSSQVVSLTNALLPASGGTGVTSLGTGVATALGQNVTGSGSIVLAASPTFTGTPLSTTAAPGTNTTQVATTAFVTAAVTTATGSLGTMSSQNANNVTITGGSITGITDLAVADGGTGRSTLAANAVLVGNGVSGVNTVAPSTTGNVLVSNGTTWTSNSIAASGIKLGLGITGEVWNDVTGSRNSGQLYTNSRAYPIMVSATGSFANGGPSLDIFVSGIRISTFNWQFNGAGARSGGCTIVPAGATYQLNFNGSGISSWAELY